MPTAEQMALGEPSRRGGKGQSLSRTTIEETLRRQKAFAARLAGKNWNEVAVEAGYNARILAIKAVHTELQEIARETRGDADRLRELEVGRLDWALTKIVEIADDETISPNTRLAALENVRKNVESRSKLLGLVQTNEINIVSVTQVEHRVAELSHKLGIPLPTDLLGVLEPGDSDQNVFTVEYDGD